MVKIFVDSGSSIKQEEKDEIGVDILPLKITIEKTEYTDGIDLSYDIFYNALIDKKIFPKTSLPSLADTEAKVKRCIENGDDVLILTISSGISGTYNTIKMLFQDEPKVRVIDTKTAVGGIRILVEEAKKYIDKPLDFIEDKLLRLIPRIQVIAIPETLEYLMRGGRLSRTTWIFGSILQIKPLITLSSADGKVGILNKERGLKKAMRKLADYLVEYNCDPNYPIVPSYTYNTKNLEDLISLTNEKYKEQMTVYDHLDPAIGCHWGPGAFGYIFVSEK